MQKEPIRIAQIMGKMNSGGVESFIMNYYRNIDRERIQFDFIVENGSTIPQKKEILELGGNIIEIPSIKHCLKYIISLTNVLYKNKYSIVHSHINALSVFPLLCAWIAGVKIRIAHSHSTSHPKEKVRNFIKFILKKTSKVFANNYCACTIHAAKWLFGKNTDVSIINNSIDIDKFKLDCKKREELRKKYGVESKFVIGNVGRFVQQKNQEFLIDVFAEVYETNKDIALMLIGEGPLEEKLKEKVNDLNLKDAVYFLGVRDNVQDFMQIFDLFAFPSLYEGLGMVVVEAQVSALPCIVSKEVPTVTKISENIEYLENNNVTIWKNTILRYISEKRDRITDCVETDLYDIKKTKYQLEELYLKQVTVKEKIRCEWIDILKGIGIILVLIGHVSENKYINNFIYCFHMPLFFFISGFLSNIHRKDFVKIKYNSLLKPYFIFAFFSFLYWVCFERFFRGQTEVNCLKVGLNIIFAKGGNENFIFNVPLWFLPCLFSVEILYFLLSKLLKNTRITNIFAMCISIISMIGIRCLELGRVIFCMDIALCVLFFYALGNIFNKLEIKKYIDGNTKKSNIIALISVVILIIASLENIRIDYCDLQFYLSFVTYLLGVVGIFLCINIARHFNKNPWLSWLGKNTLYILVMHEPIKRILIKVLSKIIGVETSIYRNNLFSILISTLILISIMIVIIAVINKVQENKNEKKKCCVNYSSI